MEIKRKHPIGVELVKRGIVTETDIQEALEYQRKNQNMKLGDILYELKVCEPRKLIEAIGDIVGGKGILLTNDLVKINISDYISIDVAKANKAIPFDIENGRIKVCFPNTVNNKKQDNVRLLLLNKGLVMETYITFEQQIDRILLSLEGNISDDITKMGNNSSSVTELVDSIIKTGIERRASDIHIEPLENEVRVRYRIDGELFTAAQINKDKQQQVIRKIKSNIKYAPRKTRITRWKNFAL